MSIRIRLLEPFSLLGCFISTLACDGSIYFFAAADVHSSLATIPPNQVPNANDQAATLYRLDFRLAVAQTSQLGHFHGLVAGQQDRLVVVVVVIIIEGRRHGGGGCGGRAGVGELGT